MLTWLKRHHIFHDWGLWSPPEIKNFQVIRNRYEIIGAVSKSVQYRKCKLCGLSERRFPEEY